MLRAVTRRGGRCGCHPAAKPCFQKTSIVTSGAATSSKPRGLPTGKTAYPVLTSDGAAIDSGIDFATGYRHHALLAGSEEKLATAEASIRAA